MKRDIGSIKQIYLSDEEFEDQFDMVAYENREDGDYLPVSCSTREKMIAFATFLAEKPDDWYRHVWTCVGSESCMEKEKDDLLLVSGVATVNGIYYVFTKQPWGEDVDVIENGKLLITVGWFIKEDWV